MNEINDIDFEQDQLERVNDSGLLNIADCCQRLVDLENEASTLEDQLDQRATAYQWLRDNNLGDIIKNEISARFGRNEDGKALEFSKLATANGYEVQQDLKVEPMTLKATLRELHEKGADLPPEEIFKTFVGRQAKVTRKK